MENKRQVGAGSLDHLFGPKDSSSSSSSHSSGIFESIFSPPSKVPGRNSGILGNQGVGGKYGNPDIMSHNSKGENSTGTNSKGKSSVYENEASEPSYFSSSIYYGGQENYSPRTRSSESKKPLKDGEDDGNNSNTASRGNWWQGSLYY